jgi:hypothetical protein
MPTTSPNSTDTASSSRDATNNNVKPDKDNINGTHDIATNATTKPSISLETIFPSNVVTFINDIKSSHLYQQSIQYLSNVNVHPGHVCVLTSMPLCLHAYNGYHQPLETIVQKIITKQSNITEESVIRRSVAISVASRALRVATFGSLGFCTLSIGILFYITNSSSVSQLIYNIKHYSQKQRISIDEYIYGPSNEQSQQQQQQLRRYDENHPEYKKLQSMNEDDELQYIYQTYFQKDYETSCSTECDIKDDTPGTGSNQDE